MSVYLAYPIWTLERGWSSLPTGVARLSRKRGEHVTDSLKQSISPLLLLGKNTRHLSGSS